MIRIRCMFELGRAHPLLGPILLVALVVLLALVLLHATHDGWDAVSELGAICFGVASVLGLVLLDRMRDRLSEALVSVRGDRGPPRSRRPRFLRPAAVAAGWRNLPLRR